ncbi:MAG: hypothetical protein IT207_07320 [Fimbriimonadaceae bacterium]|nr:hypothetical protein [Fimbriimonadaceae bacterium]
MGSKRGDDYLFASTCPILAPNEILGPTLAFLNSSANTYTEIAPTSFRTIYGRLDSGWHGSLAEIDLDVLRHCRFLVPNSTALPIEIEVTGQTSIAVPTRVKARLLGRVLNLGGYRHAVLQYNFSSGAYEDYALGNATTEFSSVVSDSILSGNHAAKVSQSGELRARYRLWKVNPSAVARYCYEADQFIWFVR